jgi:hypothetical protein
MLGLQGAGLLVSDTSTYLAQTRVGRANLKGFLSLYSPWTRTSTMGLFYLRMYIIVTQNCDRYAVFPCHNFKLKHTAYGN